MRGPQIESGMCSDSCPPFSLSDSTFVRTNRGQQGHPSSPRCVYKAISTIYPPLARQARINGEVELTLRIRPDGTLGSVSLVSGHPMLAQIAIQSAQRSQFECSGCTADLTSYSLRYKFELLPLDHTKDCACLTDEERNGSLPPKVDVPSHEITVFGKVMETCDPAVEIVKVRSAKCLYLWRCDRRDLGVVAPKCP